MPKSARFAPVAWLASAALLLACPVPARAADTVSPIHVTPNASTVAETSHVVPYGVLSLHGAAITTGAAAGYFMILNAAADPGNGAVTPVKCYVVAANSTLGIGGDTNTMWDFPKGVVLVFSTTGCFTETQSPTAYFTWQ